ncbi:MAG TPA: phosphoethanolamine--lipid A transferase [Burkholderiaceae bacterium]
MRERSGWNPLTLAFLAALWTAALCNGPLWRALSALPEMASWRGGLFMIGFALMITALTGALLVLFAWRPVIKAAIAFVLVSAAIGAHFMSTYGVVIDPTMMTNVLQTDPREVRDLLSWRMLAYVGVLAALPIALLWRVPLRSLAFTAQAVRNLAAFIAAWLVLGALVFALFADLSATMRNHRSLRYLINPLTSYFSLGVVAVESNRKPAGPPVAIGRDAKIAPRAAGTLPPLLLLVIGETARADHFALNGYARPTNPELAKLGVVSFTDVTSCGTNTAASLPCMFSHLGKQGYESRSGDYENLLDLVQRAGMAVLWVDNQAGCKGLCDRVPHAYASEPVPGAAGGAASSAGVPPSLCSGDGECLDEALLVGLDSRLAALPAQASERGVLIVLHQMGSHGPAYAKRSPPERKPFMPECTTNVLQQCDRAALVNAYDNSIAYTDHVLAQAIHWLKQREPQYAPMLLYVSDHGESLGENNLYLHGLPYAVAPREQTHVPMVAWLPAESRAASGLSLDCLGRARTQALSHDNLFHVTLGVLGIQASEYRSALDAFAPCRAP